ncbi:ABC transporter ATP-binding protein [Clostridium sporogenes]|nr:ABC transporter ATP-binding protein [Clostridium sporogenes]NFH12470.1 ATP-binding cassette domain-containing protein [Clostridium botulinum]KRU26047.1 ABC transporter ATP-binding protein [Clostridium sporogenes]KRU30535.1 ABC transporter ATP-binding protein [Clostridium sporogenes]KRU39479.1 ABC transporter ATP-binding protein [Clostridium sporogenes]
MKKKCLLSTHNLTKEYKNKKAVNNLNITVYEGDVYGFLGPNGAGKSTTIKSIMGLIKPTSGKVIINGYDVEKDSEKANDANLYGALYNLLLDEETIDIIKNNENMGD